MRRGNNKVIDQRSQDPHDNIADLAEAGAANELTSESAAEHTDRLSPEMYLG